MSALGGLAGFAGLIWIVIRATAGRVRAVDDNTAAVKELTGKLDNLATVVGDQGIRLARLEGAKGWPR
jgi:hypothetical protein